MKSNDRSSINGLFARNLSGLGVSQYSNERAASTSTMTMMPHISQFSMGNSRLFNTSTHSVGYRNGFRSSRNPTPTPPMKRILQVPDRAKYERTASRGKDRRPTSALVASNSRPRPSTIRRHHSSKRDSNIERASTASDNQKYFRHTGPLVPSKATPDRHQKTQFKRNPSPTPPIKTVRHTLEDYVSNPGSLTLNVHRTKSASASSTLTAQTPTLSLHTGNSLKNGKTQESPQSRRTVSNNTNLLERSRSEPLLTQSSRPDNVTMVASYRDPSTRNIDERRATSRISRSSNISKSATSQKQDDTHLTNEQQEIVDWMHSIGVYINAELQRENSREMTSSDVIEVFQTGVKLAELVQRVEREDIRGIDRVPTKPAATLNNINKTLSVLRKRKNINDTHLWSAENIRQGDPNVIWGLLSDIYREYASKNWRKFFRGRKREYGHQIEMTDDDSKQGERRTGLHGSNISGGIMSTNALSQKLSGAGNAEEERRLHSFRGVSDRQNGCALQNTLPVDVRRDELCTRDMEREVHRWFHQINFDSLLAKRQQEHTVTDILRNGVFLCELIGALEKDSIQDINRNPLVLSEARENIEKALSVLRRRNNIPSVFLFNGEAILQGNHEALWGLFFYIMKAYPDASTNPSQHFSKAPSLYDPASMKKLEQSILFWLASLGLFPSDDPLPRSIEDIKKRITNGTLLCDLVGIVEGRKLIGVNRNPKVKSAYLSNINKALDLLRRRKGMGTQFLWAEEDIINGDINTIMGLLEDIHRSYDSCPPRNISKKPYFGKDHHQSVSMTKKKGLGVHKAENLLPLPATPPTELRAMLPTPSKYSSIEQRSYPEPFFPSSQLSNVLLPPPHEFNASVNAIYQANYQQHAHRDQNYEPNFQDAGGRTDRYQRHYNPGQNEGKSSASKDSQSKTYLLAKWLESLGIKLKSPFSLDGPTVHEFSNGVLLCRLVSRLEHRQIEGVTEMPKRPASFLHNIRKALEVLRNKKTMPIDLLYSEEDIHRGNGQVICALLEQIKRAYNHVDWHT